MTDGLEIVDIQRPEQVKTVQASKHCTVVPALGKQLQRLFGTCNRDNVGGKSFCVSQSWA
jgi:hypothetical protein